MPYAEDALEPRLERLDLSLRARDLEYVAVVHTPVDDSKPGEVSRHVAHFSVVTRLEGSGVHLLRGDRSLRRHPLTHLPSRGNQRRGVP